MKNLFTLCFVLLLGLSGCKKGTDELMMSATVPGENIHRILFNSQGVMWMVSSKLDNSVEWPSYLSSLPRRFYLSAYQDGKYTVYSNDFKSVTDWAVDSSDRIWYLLGNELFVFENGVSRKVQNFSGKSIPSHITIDKNNNIWLAGLMAGVVKVSASNQVTYYTKAQGLPTESITGITVDPQNNIWVSYWDNKGVGKLDATTGQWSTFNTELPITRSLWCIEADDQGVIWVGTSTDAATKNNLLKYDGQQWTDLSTQTNGNVRNLYKDTGKIWTLTEKPVVNGAFMGHQVSTFDGAVWTMKKDFPIENGVSDLAINPKTKEVWISTWKSELVKLP